MKQNKIVVLIILMFMITVVFSGCGEKLPEGIENRTFFKDMKNLNKLILFSMQNQIYNEDDINGFLIKINTDEYKSGLNNYEVLILESLNDVLRDIKEELTTNEQVIQSDTFDKFCKILDMTSNDFKIEHKK